MATIDTINIEIVLKQPVGEALLEYADALETLKDYIENSPWCGLQEVLEVLERRIGIIETR